jgi:dephospho-CoA kinase
MKRVGLTGGIASGKSTVCEMLRSKGASILDADTVAHSLIRKGKPSYAHVLETFGQDILGPDGEIDRGKLGNLVFSDPEHLNLLTRILHPEVIRQILAELAKIEDETPEARVIVDASVMIESGFYRSFQYLIVVSCQPEQQRERLKARGNLLEEQVRRRIASQIPLEQKAKFADWVIDNSGSLNDTRMRVDRLWDELVQRVWAAR